MDASSLKEAILYNAGKQNINHITYTIMPLLTISCQLSESQMNNIVDSVIKHINENDYRDIPEFDKILHGVDVYVTFQYITDTVSLECACISDSYWGDTIYEDTAVFTSRLNEHLRHFNILNKEQIRQALDIQKEQKEELKHSMA
ncbi:MAG: hypothetical protein LBV11_17435 [Bacillus cereus]|jgi:hypothetical protein|nr:hypothetical protein [Bacillus cereus]